MNTVVDFILGSSNKKNVKTNSVSKNIPEIASAKKTLSELINKIIKLIAEKNELQEELNKMKKNKEQREAKEANKKAQEKNSKSLLDQIVKFDGYLSNIHESLSKEDTEKLLTGIQAKIRNNKALNTHIANTIKLNRNNSVMTTTNANKGEEVVEEVFQQNNSRRNIKKSPESLEELLGVSKNNRANNSGPKQNNNGSRVNNFGPKQNNNGSRVNNSGPKQNNNGSRVNNSGPKQNNNVSRVNNAGLRMNNNGSRTEPRVNNNVLNRNKALSKGLSSIAGIFLKKDEMDPETYNKLSNLSESIQNLER